MTKATATFSNGKEWNIKNNKAGYVFAGVAVGTFEGVESIFGGYSRTYEGAVKAAQNALANCLKLDKKAVMKMEVVTLVAK